MPVELIVGAAVGAAAASPRARNVVRKGMVYGMAGLLMAYDKLASVTSGIVKGARQGITGASEAAPAQGANGQASPAPEAPPLIAATPASRAGGAAASS